MPKLHVRSFTLVALLLVGLGGGMDIHAESAAGGPAGEVNVPPHGQYDIYPNTFGAPPYGNLAVGKFFGGKADATLVIYAEGGRIVVQGHVRETNKQYTPWPYQFWSNDGRGPFGFAVDGHAEPGEDAGNWEMAGYQGKMVKG